MLLGEVNAGFWASREMAGLDVWDVAGGEEESRAGQGQKERWVAAKARASE